MRKLSRKLCWLSANEFYDGGVRCGFYYIFCELISLGMWIRDHFKGFRSVTGSMTLLGLLWHLMKKKKVSSVSTKMHTKYYTYNRLNLRVFGKKNIH